MTKRLNKVSKTFSIEWMNFNGAWRVCPGPLYLTRRDAQKAMRMLGLDGNPAYRVR